MAYPQYNSVETIDITVTTSGRWKGFMATTTGAVVFDTMNGETQTITIATGETNVIFPIGIKRFHSTTAATIFGLN